MKKIIAFVTFATLAFLSAGCNQLSSRYHMNQGIQAYKNKQFNEAVDHFSKSVNLDPSNINGKLYLATAYMIQYVPGSSNASNLQLAAKARMGFLDVLKDHPNDSQAEEYLAQLSLQEAITMPVVTPKDQEMKLAKLDEAKAWFDKAIQGNPKSKDDYYSLGVIDWLKWYPNLMTARATAGMKQEDPGPLKDPKVRADLKAKYSAIIEDGIKNLEIALKIDPNYVDAMAYLNLLYRERADLADSPDQYKGDIAQAETYFQKALKTKQAKPVAASS